MRDEIPTPPPLFALKSHYLIWLTKRLLLHRKIREWPFCSFVVSCLLARTKFHQLFQKTRQLLNVIKIFAIQIPKTGKLRFSPRNIKFLFSGYIIQDRWTVVLFSVTNFWWQNLLTIAKLLLLIVPDFHRNGPMSLIGLQLVFALPGACALFYSFELLTTPQL